MNVAGLSVDLTGDSFCGSLVTEKSYLLTTELTQSITNM